MGQTTRLKRNLEVDMLHTAMERLFGKVALVTGASSGIGAGLVKALVTHGMKVVGCARNIEKLQILRDKLNAELGIMVPIQCDVSKPDEVLSMFDVIKTDPKLRGVDICINNAGLAHTGPLLTGDYKKWKEMIDLNVLSLCLCSREAYKSMKERKVNDGHIVFINSTVGHIIHPVSDLHFYTATKFAVTAVTEGLRQELAKAKSGIRVSAVSPGMVDTDLIARHMGNEDIAKIYGGIPPIRAVLKIEDVANTVLFILQAPPHIQVHDIMMRPTGTVA